MYMVATLNYPFTAEGPSEVERDFDGDEAEVLAKIAELIRDDEATSFVFTVSK